MGTQTLILISLLALLASGCKPRESSTTGSPQVNQGAARSTKKGSEEDWSKKGAEGEDGKARKEGPKKGETQAGDTGRTESVALSRVAYRPLGLTPGGYTSIREAQWPNKCIHGDKVVTTGPLFPFNEPQTLVVRGPQILSELVVYRKKSGQWIKGGDLRDLIWREYDYGTVRSLGIYPRRRTLLENGREVFAALPFSGESIVVFQTQMPRADAVPYTATAQNDVPAVWLLNSKNFQEPSNQYFCNCRGLGNPGGCGELDIVEVIPEAKDELTTTLYSYEGARGSKFEDRPSREARIYAAVLRTVGEVDEGLVLRVSQFDFSKTSLTEDFLQKQWMSEGTSLNKGQEA